MKAVTVRRKYENGSDRGILKVVKCVFEIKHINIIPRIRQTQNSISNLYHVAFIVGNLSFSSVLY
jgi:hypothetical protein